MFIKFIWSLECGSPKGVLETWNWERVLLSLQIVYICTLSLYTSYFTTQAKARPLSVVNLAFVLSW